MQFYYNWQWLVHDENVQQTIKLCNRFYIVRSNFVTQNKRVSIFKDLFYITIYIPIVYIGTYQVTKSLFFVSPFQREKKKIQKGWKIAARKIGDTFIKEKRNSICYIWKWPYYNPIYDVFSAYNIHRLWDLIQKIIIKLLANITLACKLCRAISVHRYIYMKHKHIRFQNYVCFIVCSGSNYVLYSVLFIMFMKWTLFIVCV